MPGQYRLRVEGNTDRALGGTAFLNETVLAFSQRSMTIFIQTEKPIYHQSQIGIQISIQIRRPFPPPYFHFFHVFPLGFFSIRCLFHDSLPLRKTSGGGRGARPPPLFCFDCPLVWVVCMFI